jgi:sugar/nucleoside kinase (ribokinase family)
MMTSLSSPLNAMPISHSGVIDTLGAGDTFNAGMIVGRACGLSVQTSLEFACRFVGILS